jgi:hypothetical protein
MTMIHTLWNRAYRHFATIMLNCFNLLHAGLQMNRTKRAKPQLGLFSGADRLLRLGIGFSQALKILLRLDLNTRTSIYSQACSRANRAGPLLGLVSGANKAPHSRYPSSLSIKNPGRSRSCRKTTLHPMLEIIREEFMNWFAERQHSEDKYARNCCGDRRQR